MRPTAMAILRHFILCAAVLLAAVSAGVEVPPEPRNRVRNPSFELDADRDARYAWLISEGLKIDNWPPPGGLVTDLFFLGNLKTVVMRPLGHPL